MSEQAPTRADALRATAARVDLASVPAARHEPPLPPPETPFVGLVPFAARDAPFFFGRERERRLIAANLMASRLTLLYGASGVGKSSVLRAGVEHDLRAFAGRELRQGNLPEWIPVVFASWRDDPLSALRDEIAATLAATFGELAPEPPSAGRFDDALTQWIADLDALAGDAHGDRRMRLLIILDQFEEYFLYHADDDGAGTIAVELPAAVNREGLRRRAGTALRHLRDDDARDLPGLLSAARPAVPALHRAVDPAPVGGQGAARPGDRASADTPVGRTPCPGCAPPARVVVRRGSAQRDAVHGPWPAGPAGRQTAEQAGDGCGGPSASTFSATGCAASARRRAPAAPAPAPTAPGSAWVTFSAGSVWETPSSAWAASGTAGAALAAPAPAAAKAAPRAATPRVLAADCFMKCVLEWVTGK